MKHLPLGLALLLVQLPPQLGKALAGGIEVAAEPLGRGHARDRAQQFLGRLGEVSEHLGERVASVLEPTQRQLDLADQGQTVGDVAEILELSLGGQCILGLG